jgi:hypothetical protein
VAAKRHVERIKGMTIGAIEIHESAIGDELEITMRGTPEKIVQVLVSGLPREALMQLNDALAAEIASRAVEAQDATK